MHPTDPAAGHPQDAAPALFLGFDNWIDGDHPAVARQAAVLAGASSSPLALVQNSFEFVRDRIAHSGDAGRGPITCKASDTLVHEIGYCYAKSHLLAALLRANGVPTALCYQRLSVGGGDGPYCLHGLNAVFLPDHGWYRIDARGNKPGVDARFTPPREQLAFAIQEAGERDLRGLYAAPLAVVVRALTTHASVAQLGANLPDMPGLY